MSVSGTSAPAVSPYVAEYQNLQVYDTAELMQVSFGSPDAAAANVASVLAQAAALQKQQLAAQQQAAQAVPRITSDPLASLPSLQDVIGQSDGAANAALQQQASGAGTIFDTLA